jgi:uncharacterized membrane protein
MTDSMISDPTAIFGFLAAILGFVFWLSGLDRMQAFFKIAPPVIWAYFLPMITTTVGITPISSPAYTWMTTYLLPFSLFLLMLSVDLRAILRLGRTALIMLLTGTAGIVIGGPIVYLMFRSALPDDAWKGLASLSGSWIGGTANMTAIKESVGASDALLGPIIVVDTVVGYGWMGILLFLSPMQERFNQWVGADTSIIEETNRKLNQLDLTRRPASINDLSVIVGLGMLATVVSIAISGNLPKLGDPTVISSTTWAVLIVVTAGLALSFTPARQLEQAGASKIGFLALYLLLTAIGARANLAAVLDAPVYLLAGLVWILIHVGLLLLVARIIRAPLFFVATGSMANIGGAASAPVVAGVYYPAMAPVGLLMAIAGYVLGIYAALGCAWMLGALSSL